MAQHLKKKKKRLEFHYRLVYLATDECKNKQHKKKKKPPIAKVNSMAIFSGARCQLSDSEARKPVGSERSLVESQLPSASC